jgi:hypothetical protein
MSKIFECAQFTAEKAPDDFREWPEAYRRASDGAIARLLAMEPNAKVIEDTSFCMDENHERFPVPDENMKRLNWKFALVRTIKVDRDIPEIEPGDEPQLWSAPA